MGGQPEGVRSQPERPFGDLSGHEGLLRGSDIKSILKVDFDSCYSSLFFESR